MLATRHRPAQTLTEVDREAAMRLALRVDEDRLLAKLQDARDRNAAVERAIDLYFRKRLPPWQHSPRPGEPTIVAKVNGLHVEIGGRRGIVRYVDLVDEACDFSEPVHSGPASAKRVERAQDNGGNKKATETKESARNGGLDPGRFGVKSTSLPDGIALEELARRGRQADGVEAAPSGATLLDLLISAINPNPWQPRKDFAKADIAEFAETMRAGLIMPIVVRLTPGTANVYQLVDGERRLRAAKELGWARIAAVVRGYTDQEMQDLALRANDARKDLNPVERAAAYQRILDERALKPVDLEKITGKSQGYISNHLRLLKLPKEWRERVAAGEITLTHARHLMPVAKNERIMKVLAGQYKPGKPITDSQDEFERSVVNIIHNFTRPMEGTHWSQKHCDRIKIFKPSAADLETLDVIEVEKQYGPGKEKRATNVELWEKLWKKHVRDTKAPKRPAAGGYVAPKKKKPSPKEIAKREAEEFAEKLRAWKADWLSYLIAKRLVGFKADEDLTFRVLLYVAAGCDGCYDCDFAPDVVFNRMVGSKRKYGGTDLAQFLKLDEPAAAAVEFVRRMFWDSIDGQEQPARQLPPATILALGKFLKLDLAAAWAKEKAGPLTEAFLELHSDDRLVSLAMELKLDPDETPIRADLVEVFLKAKKLKLPKEIAAVKEGQR